MISILGRISIGRKISGSMTLLLACMLGIILVSYFQMVKVDNELKTLSQGAIPIANLVSVTNMAALEQELVLERVLSHLKNPQANQALIQKEEKLLGELGVSVDNELARLGEIMAKTIPQVTHRGDAITLSQILPLLDLVEKEHQDYQEHVGQMIQLAQAGQLEKQPWYQSQLEKEADDLNQILAKMNSIAAALSAREAKEVLQGELATHDLVLLLSLAVFALGLVLSPLISRNIIKPLLRIIEGSKEVAAGNLDLQLPVVSSDEVGQLTLNFNDMTIELKNKARIKETFGKYVDPRIVENLLGEPGGVDISQSKKEVMTIFFSDIEGFSSISESLTPDGLVRLINRYFSLASLPIARRKGVIDKFIGDAIMAYWGPPFTPAEAHAKLACAATLEQFTQLDELNNNLAEMLHFRKGLPQIKIRVGLATGEVVAGNIGSDQAKSYTVMGDTVNVAARLESANKQYGTRILISEATHDLVQDEFETRIIDNIIVVGKSEPTAIYQLLGKAGQVESPVLEVKGHYELAYQSYLRQDWSAALAHLSQAAQVDPQDRPTQILQERIQYFQANPPDSPWDGVWRMTKK